VDRVGNIYVADHENSTIRKVSPTGVVTTLAGRASGFVGSADGRGGDARFHHPSGVAVDSTGNVYVADTGNSTIRRITPSGVASTLAGVAGNRGSADGPASTARFGDPLGVAVDGTGNVYVTDRYNPTIRKIVPGGVVSTLAGLAGSYGSDDGTGSAARFLYPTGVSADNAGNIYVADSDNHDIRLGKAVLVTEPVLSANSRLQLADGQFQFEVTASTNQLVLIQTACELAATNWLTTQTVTLWNGRSTIADLAAADFPLRFYRAVSPVP
jgi:streptogramin lyase